MTPVVRPDWTVYIDGKLFTRELFNSDNQLFWGTGDVYNPDIRAELVDKEKLRYRLVLNLPPLAALIIK
jgi:1,4-alpha-glucan branching enzyme